MKRLELARYLPYRLVSHHPFIMSPFVSLDKVFLNMLRFFVCLLFIHSITSSPSTPSISKATAVALSSSNSIPSKNNSNNSNPKSSDPRPANNRRHSSRNRDPSHPRWDPSTRFIYKRIKDRGIVVTIQLNLPDVGKDCSRTRQPLQILTWIQHALRRVGCKAAYIEALPSPSITSSSAREDTVCYNKVLHGKSQLHPEIQWTRNGKLIHPPVLAAGLPNNSPYRFAARTDVYIIISHQLPLPSVQRTAGIVYIGIFVDMTGGEAVEQYGKPSEGMEALSQYDHLLVTNAQEEDYIKTLVQSTIQAYTTESNQNKNESLLMIPAITTLKPPLDSQLTTWALKYSHKKYQAADLEPRHISISTANTSVAAFIGQYGSSPRTNALDIANAFKAFVAMLTPDDPAMLAASGLGGIGKLADPCSQEIIPRLYLIGQWTDILNPQQQQPQEELLQRLSSIYVPIGLLQCQVVIVDANNKTATTTALTSSAMLWTHYQGIDTAAFTSPNPKPSASNPLHDLISLALINEAMAAACIPVILFNPQEISLALMSQKASVVNGTSAILVTSVIELVAQSKSLRTINPQQLLAMHKYGAATVASMTLDNLADQLDSILGGEVLDTTPRDFIASVKGLPTLRAHSRNSSRPVRVTTTTKSYAAVIIEPRSHRYLEYVVRNVWLHIKNSVNGKWTILILHSTGRFGNEAFIRYALRDLTVPNKVTLQFRSISQDGHLDYNRYLRSVDLWSSLRMFEKVLMFQTDSLLLSYDIDRFLPFDYIGAPWHFNQFAPSYAWFKGLRKFGYFQEGVGNGGLSLRNPRIMLQIAEWYKHKTSVAANEDVFFISKFDRFDRAVLRLPVRSQAYAFAVEVPCEDIDMSSVVTSSTSRESVVIGKAPLLSLSASANQTAMLRHLPLGLHSTWVYVDTDEAVRLLEMSALDQEQLKMYLSTAPSN